MTAQRLHSLNHLRVHFDHLTREWEVDFGPGTKILASSPDWPQAVSAASRYARRWRSHFAAYGW